jgi:hypothetical protein
MKTYRAEESLHVPVALLLGTELPVRIRQEVGWAPEPVLTL